jgi:hypothetical protein
MLLKMKEVTPGDQSLRLIVRTDGKEIYECRQNYECWPCCS